VNSVRSARSTRSWSVRPAARLRLICLPHAGGGAASYRAWDALLPPGVDLLAVQYAGREDRWTDPMTDRMDELVHELADDLLPLLDRPYALFGHSMGSALAWELAHLLTASGAGPRRLFASGREAPGTARPGTLHRQDAAALVAELERLGGTPREILADPDLLDAVLTYVRNDYRLIETYRPDLTRAPLACPITVLAGDSDPDCDLGRGERSGGWAALTSARTSVQTFPGGHFYLGPERSRLLALILRQLDSSFELATRWPSTP
jgi:pyochelin biosynthetic protein PchC